MEAATILGMIQMLGNSIAKAKMLYTALTLALLSISVKDRGEQSTHHK
jgi:hypothetical protein